LRGTGKTRDSVGQTVAQNIVARPSGRSAVEAGEYVDVSPDYTCCQELACQAWPYSDRMIEIWREGSLTRAMRLRLAVSSTAG
jgi:hypothetical protein